MPKLLARFAVADKADQARRWYQRWLNPVARTALNVARHEIRMAREMPVSPGKRDCRHCGAPGSPASVDNPYIGGAKRIIVARAPTRCRAGAD
ncbi:MAG: hypothetical protein KJZ83_00135 [Burkholderiaceae bacterium]|nr:hypothetical protein [Burkholderiaceae bacterium]